MRLASFFLFILFYSNLSLADYSRMYNPQTVFWKPFPYRGPLYHTTLGMVTASIDHDFTPRQKSALDEALKVVSLGFSSPDVTNCAYRNSTKDMPMSRNYFEYQLAELTDKHRIRRRDIIISKIWDDPEVAGRGFVREWKDNDEIGDNEVHKLGIGLNSDVMGDWYIDPDYWAGVIAHEVLHNLGYQHPTGYEGSFIDEYGDCLYKNYESIRRWNDHVDRHGPCFHDEDEFVSQNLYKTSGDR